jgi:hypothetical protein
LTFIVCGAGLARLGDEDHWLKRGYVGENLKAFYCGRIKTFESHGQIVLLKGGARLPEGKIPEAGPADRPSGFDRIDWL